MAYAPALDLTTLFEVISPTGGRLQPVLMRPPPPLSFKPGGGGGGRRVCGGFARGGRGFPRWGGLRAAHYYHMHTSRGDVCLGRVWGTCWWLL